MSLEFKTATRRVKPIEFTLDDKKYTFTPPKTAGVVLGFIGDDGDGATALFDWLGEGLGEEQEETLIARLKDKKDDFDTADLMNIAKALLEQVSARPTQSSGD